MRSRLQSSTADTLIGALCWCSMAGFLVGFTWLVADVVIKGAGELSLTFITAAPTDAGRAGGIGPILVSTFLILAVCLLVALPIGVGAAAWLAEIARPGGRGALLVRRSLDLLASVPSIVFGLFGMVFFCQFMQLGFSILSGGLTLAAMILPIVVQTTYAGFRAVPDDLRLAGAALGFRQVTTVRHLLLPAAIHGVVIGVILGTGRALAETAALIFTSGYVTRMPESLLDSGRTLSVHIYDMAMNVPGGEKRAYATALVLVALLFVINLAAQQLTALWLRSRMQRG